jgi:hypothetical protein
MMKKKRRIYTDTSVIGGCFDPEFATWSNGLFKDFENGVYQPVVSEVVALEIKEAPRLVFEKYLELFDYDIEFVHITNIVLELAEIYIERKILTKKHLHDARHIALATVYEVDILASWNFRHIVRFDKVQLFNAVNLEQGYKMISIYSPNLITTTLIA